MKFSLIGLSISLIALFGVRFNGADDKGSFLLSRSTDKNAVFYDVKNDVFYLLQTNAKLNIPTKCSFVEYQNGLLTILDVATSTPVSYALSENIYGVSKMKGNKYNEVLLSKRKTRFVEAKDAKLDAIVAAVVPCGCRIVGSGSECQSGGSGSTSCSTSGRIGAFGERSCSVSCNSGYYACCNK